MAESTPLKRLRIDQPGEATDADENKRQKSSNYNHIFTTFLDDEVEEPTQDLSSFLTSLQDELSSDFPAPADPDSSAVADATTTTVYDYACCSSSSSSSSNFDSKEVDEEDDKERVIRHLLEASDDELGIPMAQDGGAIGDLIASESGEGYPMCDGWWEFEDANANYYTMLQSELFM